MNDRELAQQAAKHLKATREAVAANEKRVCSTCEQVIGPYAAASDPFLILNSKTDIWHSGGGWGVTDCGKDATRDHWQ